MSARTVVTVLLALVFGVSTAVGVHQFTGHGDVAPKGETAQVVVVIRDIPRGGLITSDVVRTREWRKEDVPQGALTKPEDSVERCALVPLAKGEVILEGKLASKGAGRGLAALVPSGMRAFTILAPHLASGVAGFVLPGNRVDVLLTINTFGDTDLNGGGITTTLLQKVEILAVDQRLDAPSENKVDPKELRSVTLLVTPDQAAKLDLGQNRGTLHLSLRNPEDIKEADTRPATLADLRFHQEGPQGDSVRAQPVLQIRTLRGTLNGVSQLEPFDTVNTN